ncbi:hypothetical protein NECID01_1925 [Nematocida sp. AWRm77]|nr:hypothetical protein NECID01_1925 [Nematocida sp. AWRm77]
MDRQLEEDSDKYLSDSSGFKRNTTRIAKQEKESSNKEDSTKKEAQSPSRSVNTLGEPVSPAASDSTPKIASATIKNPSIMIRTAKDMRDKIYKEATDPNDPDPLKTYLINKFVDKVLKQDEHMKANNNIRSPEIDEEIKAYYGFICELYLIEKECDPSNLNGYKNIERHNFIKKIMKEMGGIMALVSNRKEHGIGGKVQDCHVQIDKQISKHAELILSGMKKSALAQANIIKEKLIEESQYNMLYSLYTEATFKKIMLAYDDVWHGKSEDYIKCKDLSKELNTHLKKYTAMQLTDGIKVIDNNSIKEFDGTAYRKSSNQYQSDTKEYTEKTKKFVEEIAKNKKFIEQFPILHPVKFSSLYLWVGIVVFCIANIVYTCLSYILSSMAIAMSYSFLWLGIELLFGATLPYIGGGKSIISVGMGSLFLFGFLAISGVSIGKKYKNTPYLKKNKLWTGVWLMTRALELFFNMCWLLFICQKYLTCTDLHTFARIDTHKDFSVLMVPFLEILVGIMGIRALFSFIEEYTYWDGAKLSWYKINLAKGAIILSGIVAFAFCFHFFFQHKAMFDYITTYVLNANTIGNVMEGYMDQTDRFMKLVIFIVNAITRVSNYNNSIMDYAQNSYNVLVSAM